MFRRNNLFVLPGAALLMSAVVSTAQSQVRLLSVEQTRPGQVIAHLQSSDATELAAGDLALRLDPETADVPATRLAPLAVEANQTALVVCVDRSGSMGSAGVNAVAAALRQTLVPLAGGSSLPVNVDIVSFATTYRHLTAGFTDDPKTIDAALAQLRVESGRAGKTHLDDAIVEGIGELRASTAPYRRLLVISDGNDEGSDTSETVLLAQATASPSITVDAVGFGTLATLASGSLAKVAGATEGLFVLADNQTDLTAAIARLMRAFVAGNRYDVEFDFPAATGRPVATASLVYKNVTFPIKTALTGIQPAAKTPPPEKPSILKSILKFVIDFRFLIALGFVCVTSITTVVVVVVKRKEPKPGGNPPPTVTQPENPPVNPQRRPPRTTRIAYSWPLPSGNQPVAILESLAGANHGKRWIVNHKSFKIGSAGDNDLVLERDDFVSSHHAVIKAEGNSLYVTDLGSLNGTRVNGELLKSGTRPLLPGDQIGLGQTLIEVRAASAENVRANRGAAQRG